MGLWLVHWIVTYSDGAVGTCRPTGERRGDRTAGGAGDLGSAGRLDHLARLWTDLSREHGREFAFRLLREGEGTT